MPNSMRNRKKKSNQGNRAQGFINISFVSKKRLDDVTLSDEDLINGPKVSMSKGAPIMGTEKDDKIMRAIVDKAYDAIEEYLDADPGNTVDDPECPKLSVLKTVVLNVYSAERHEELFGGDEDIDDDDL